MTIVPQLVVIVNVLGNFVRGFAAGLTFISVWPTAFVATHLSAGDFWAAVATLSCSDEIREIEIKAAISLFTVIPIRLFQVVYW